MDKTSVSPPTLSGVGASESLLLWRGDLGVGALPAHRPAPSTHEKAFSHKPFVVVVVVMCCCSFVFAGRWSSRRGSVVDVSCFVVVGRPRRSSSMSVVIVVGVIFQEKLLISLT